MTITRTTTTTATPTTTNVAIGKPGTHLYQETEFMTRLYIYSRNLQEKPEYQELTEL